MIIGIMHNVYTLYDIINYYHFFAVFDKAIMNIKRWSHLFKFEGEKIEYALVIIILI